MVSRMLVLVFMLVIVQDSKQDVAAGAWKEAEEEYRAVLSPARNYAEAHANLGAVLMRRDRYEEPSGPMKLR